MPPWGKKLLQLPKKSQIMGRLKIFATDKKMFKHPKI